MGGGCRLRRQCLGTPFVGELESVCQCLGTHSGRLPRDAPRSAASARTSGRAFVGEVGVEVWGVCVPRRRCRVKVTGVCAEALFAKS